MQIKELGKTPEADQPQYAACRTLLLPARPDPPVLPGALQIWRMTDLIYIPRDEALAELEDFKAHVARCGPKA
ncbi:hypothetical protein L1987_18671 [Smallanthus sonchifolius]|uniref:Uncharacterized protein n=1 Tax=Smallanthus sonchifolius TaxID=185202 RepID=A0ACB9J1F0_9ASTR|nr:hypothetical protein L1987_18671 [Smallanthus sonchifolius]